MISGEQSETFILNLNKIEIEAAITRLICDAPFPWLNKHCKNIVDPKLRSDC